MEKKVIVYDIVSVPSCMSIEDVLRCATETGFLFWESVRKDGRKNNCEKPYMANPNDECEKILVDISTEEGQKIYNEIKEKQKTVTD